MLPIYVCTASCRIRRQSLPSAVCFEANTGGVCYIRRYLGRVSHCQLGSPVVRAPDLCDPAGSSSRSTKVDYWSTVPERTPCAISLPLSYRTVLTRFVVASSHTSGFSGPLPMDIKWVEGNPTFFVCAEFSRLAIAVRAVPYDLCSPESPLKILPRR